MNFDLQITVRRSIIEDARRIYHNAARFQWEQSFVLGTLNKLRNESRYSELPRYERTFIEGVIHQLDHEHWKLLVFTYEFAGHGRLSIESDEYRTIPPAEVSQFWSHTGAFAYRSDLNKLYTNPSTPQPLNPSTTPPQDQKPAHLRDTSNPQQEE